MLQLIVKLKPKMLKVSVKSLNKNVQEIQQS